MNTFSHRLHLARAAFDEIPRSTVTDHDSTSFQVVKGRFKSIEKDSACNRNNDIHCEMGDRRNGSESVFG
ncbi:hypothetical protein PILCRDRAFT_826901 [Piloderma croceum F 1598]|uniref:Uncharacterized protein n=1 Tax=Piloderma croceum (strain F 1598) TaxID=765440 RepID=A0A0C3F7I5_PILCF|nr:hypothetical protein PILCRDRAFT_826901 [Piloderma croceum F 1598]